MTPAGQWAAARREQLARASASHAGNEVVVYLKIGGAKLKDFNVADAKLFLAQVVDRAVEEYAARHADAINEGIERARLVLAGGDAAIAAHLLGVPAEDIQRIAGRHPGANADPA